MIKFSRFLPLLVMAAVGVNAGPLTFSQTFFNTNYVTAALGLRSVGSGTMTVSGLGGPVTSALLYWHGPTNSADPDVNANVNFGGSSISGTNIGVADDNFWNSPNSQAYRADVTTQLAGGNGAYVLSNFENANALANGAFLLALFGTGRDLVLYQGNDSNFASPTDSAGWDFALSNINYVSGTARLVLYVSDGQDFGSSDDGTLRINGSSLASGGLAQGIATRAPGAGVTNGSLTDVLVLDITPFLTPGLNNLNITLEPGFNDALSLVAAVVDLPAGAAPPNPIPEPATFGLVVGALALFAAVQKRR